MRLMDKRIIFGLLVIFLTFDRIVTQTNKDMDAQCNAPAIDMSQLDTTDQSLLQALQHIAPKIRSTEPIDRGVLKAPVHMPCQVKKYPSLQLFQKYFSSNEFSDKLTIQPFAQPPHFVFFDKQGKVVRVVPLLTSTTISQIKSTLKDAFEAML